MIDANLLFTTPAAGLPSGTCTVVGAASGTLPNGHYFTRIIVMCPCGVWLRLRDHLVHHMVQNITRPVRVTIGDEEVRHTKGMVSSVGEVEETPILPGFKYLAVELELFPEQGPPVA